MTFLWPELLWLLLLVPALIAIYFALLRRKKRLALRYASLGMISRALGPGRQLRRHIPPLVFLIALVTLIVAVARPSATLTLPAQYETIVLAIDISGSMRASDVKPNRIAAAQEAAKKFIADQPASARIGLVSFAATASVVQPPTRDRESIVAALDRLQLQRGTAVGSGILVALKTIFPDVEFDLRASNPRGETRPAPLDGAGGDKPATKADPGSVTSAAIILLTDGQTTTGPNPIEAARMAAERGVRVFTVGIGTTRGEILGSEGWSMRVKLDEDALKNIAQVTRAEYFFADNDVDLKKIYDSLNTRLSLETRQTEITALLAAAAAALSLVSAFLSVLWFNRIL
ncbi:MAG TPA: VWA domain-containing protein [Casimicrobiaceae bacterium]|nr:VWA domain-containing protein [Casimicrobiaceae bacterium]